MARRSPALFAWALCGTLDILYAAAWSLLAGGTVGGMLRGVAKGPFGDAAGEWGLGGALAGLATHYAIMGAMVAFWFAAVRRVPALRQPVASIYNAFRFSGYALAPPLLGLVYGPGRIGAVYVVCALASGAAAALIALLGPRRER